jgi:hypothetical protein
MKFDENIEKQIKYLHGKNSPLFLIKFHPSGEPEASICGVAKDSK